MRAPPSELPVRFDGVALTLGGVTVIDRIDISFDPGPPTFIVGPNGSGKSTVIRLAMGLVAPTEGRVSWGGRTGRPGRRCAMVFQRPTMLRRSALGNVAYAIASAGMPKREWTDRAAALLDQVGLAHVAARPARRLSGGEQQRLALARALARDPEILFLDEPTASLDPASTKSVEDILRVVAASGVKIVMSTHDLGQARRLAGDVVLLLNGRVVERAPAARFFSDPQTEQAASFLRGELVI